MFQTSSKWSVNNVRHQSSSCCSSGVTSVSIYKWLYCFVLESICRLALMNVKHHGELNMKVYDCIRHILALLTRGVFAFLLQISEHCAHAPFVPIILYFRVIAAESKRNLDCQHCQNNVEEWAMLTWLANTRISSNLKTHSRLGVINNEKWLFILFLTA